MKRFQAPKASQLAGLLFVGSMALTLTGCMTLPGNQFSCSWPRLRRPFTGPPSRYEEAGCGVTECGTNGCGVNGQPAHSAHSSESLPPGMTPLPPESGGAPPSSRDPQVAPDPDVANRWTPPRLHPGAIHDEFDPVSRTAGGSVKPVLNSVPPITNARPDLAPPMNGPVGTDSSGNPIGSDPYQANAYQNDPYQQNPIQNHTHQNGSDVGRSSCGVPPAGTAPACEAPGSTAGHSKSTFGIASGLLAPINPFAASEPGPADSIGGHSGYLGGAQPGQVYGHSVMSPSSNVIGSTPFGMHTGSAYPVPHPSVLRHREINEQQQSRCKTSTSNTGAECSMQILPNAGRMERNRAAALDEWSRIPANRGDNTDDQEQTSNSRPRNQRSRVTELAPPGDVSSTWHLNQSGDSAREQPVWGDDDGIPAWQSIPPQAWVTRDVTPKSNHADARTGISRMSGSRQSAGEDLPEPKLPRPWKASRSVNWSMPPK